jgi:heme/copper-type cytochrome/quinol oxidase subunit 2
VFYRYAGNLLCNGTICSISPSPSPNHNSNNLAVIVGTTVGGVLVVVAIIVLVVFRSYKRQQNHEDKEKLVEIRGGIAAGAFTGLFSFHVFNEFNFFHNLFSFGALIKFLWNLRETC